MNQLDELLRVLQDAMKLGERTTSLGAHLWGHVPHVAPSAWLHVTYRGLTLQEIELLERKVGKKFPEPFKEFLLFSNGLNLFSGSLAIYGSRQSYERVGDAVWQPFAIETPNCIERPAGAPDSYLFIGGYADDGSKLVIDIKSLAVHRIAQRTSGPVLNAWSGFWEMLQSEVRRIAVLFDEVGRIRDPSTVTTP